MSTNPIDHRAAARVWLGKAGDLFSNPDAHPEDITAAAAVSQAHTALAAIDAQERTAAALEDLVRLATEVQDGDL